MSSNRNRQFGFGKEEKLCSRQLIERLYTSPNRGLFFPLSIHWMAVETDDDKPRAQVLIVAPKRKLRHAVDRNRTKRLIRECYRLHKRQLLDALANHDKHMVLSLNYIHSKPPNFHKLEATMEKLIAHLAETAANDD